jgi:RND family efflux transporter MFP subunit
MAGRKGPPYMTLRPGARSLKPEARVSVIIGFRLTYCLMSRSIASILLLLSLAAAACGGSDPQAATGGGPPAMPPMEVRTITLAEKPVPQTSEFVATVRSLRSTTIQPQVDGFIRQIFVRSGDRVRAGQPLVQIDPDRQQAAATVTESQRAAREAELALAKQQLERIRTLHAAGAVARAQLDEAEAAHTSAEAQVKAIESQIRQDQVQLKYYRVTAPTAGIIGDIPVRQGDLVTPATMITTIDQGDQLEAYVNVPLEQATRLRPGLTVELLDSNGEVIASNPITFIAPRADDATQSVLAKATLRPTPPSIRVMQYVRARIIWNNDPGLVVPLVAVNRIGGQFFIFVAEDSEKGTVARQRPVTLGEVIGEDYIVRGGLKPGERIIVSNLQKIGDGAPVKPS